MSKKVSGRVINLPFPELLFPYSPVAKPMPPLEITNVCEGDRVCVSFSCSLVPYLLGLLEVYRYKDSFQGTDEQKYNSVGVMAQLMEVLAMACCGDDSSTVTIHRLNPVTGSPEISKDDGATWTSDPESPYNKAVLAPPPPILDTGDARCKAANNTIGEMRRLQAKYAGYLDSISDLEDFIVTVIVDLAAILLLPLLGEALVLILTPLIPKVLGVLRDIFSMTAAEYNALFTEEVWDKARCVVYCSTPDDLNYTQTDWQRIQQQLKGKLGASSTSAGASLASMVDFWGVIGLKNASRIGDGGDESCDACSCADEWWYEFDFTQSAFNAIWQPYTETDGHYVAGEGYAPTIPLDVGHLVIAADFTSYGGLDLIGVISETQGADVTNYNRGLFWNETRANYDTSTDIVIDGSSLWASYTGGFQNVHFLAPQWVGPSAGGGDAVRLTRVVLHGKGLNPFGADNYVYDPLSP